MMHISSGKLFSALCLACLFIQMGFAQAGQMTAMYITFAGTAIFGLLAFFSKENKMSRKEKIITVLMLIGLGILFKVIYYIFIVR
jgi:hypothetical protein